MKIVVFSDIHSSVSGMQKVLTAAHAENPDKVVFCGDLFGGWSNGESQVAAMAQSIDSTLYFVRGNNDRASCDSLIAGGFEQNAIMYHFGRTLFFTHGDIYNGWRVPPILRQGDVLVFGHTHVGSLTKRNGLFVFNVGSVSLPRDGQPCYLVLDESGATLKTMDGKDLYKLGWN